MKSLATLLLSLLLAGLSAAQETATKTPAELLKLRKQRDAAAATALAPINKRYRQDLVDLQKRYTRDGNLDAALAVKAELEAVGAASAGPSVALTASAFARRIRGEWSFYAGDKFEGPVTKLILSDDGVCQGPNGASKWKVVEPGVIDVITANNFWRLVFDRDLMSYKSDPSVGHKEPKCGKLLEKN